MTYTPTGLVGSVPLDATSELHVICTYGLPLSVIAGVQLHDHTFTITISQLNTTVSYDSSVSPASSRLVFSPTSGSSGLGGYIQGSGGALIFPGGGTLAIQIESPNNVNVKATNLHLAISHPATTDIAVPGSHFAIGSGPCPEAKLTCFTEFSFNVSSGVSTIEAAKLALPFGQATLGSTSKTLTFIAGGKTFSFPVDVTIGTSSYDLMLSVKDNTATWLTLTNSGESWQTEVLKPYTLQLSPLTSLTLDKALASSAAQPELSFTLDIGSKEIGSSDGLMASGNAMLGSTSAITMNLSCTRASGPCDASLGNTMNLDLSSPQVTYLGSPESDVVSVSAHVSGTSLALKPVQLDIRAPATLTLTFATSSEAPSVLLKLGNSSEKVAVILSFPSAGKAQGKTTVSAPSPTPTLAPTETESAVPNSINLAASLMTFKVTGAAVTLSDISELQLTGGPSPAPSCGPGTAPLSASSTPLPILSKDVVQALQRIQTPIASFGLCKATFDQTSGLDLEAVVFSPSSAPFSENNFNLDTGDTAPKNSDDRFTLADSPSPIPVAGFSLSVKLDGEATVNALPYMTTSCQDNPLQHLSLEFGTFCLDSLSVQIVNGSLDRVVAKGQISIDKRLPTVLTKLEFEAQYNDSVFAAIVDNSAENSPPSGFHLNELRLVLSSTLRSVHADYNITVGGADGFTGVVRGTGFTQTRVAEHWKTHLDAGKVDLPSSVLSSTNGILHAAQELGTFFLGALAHRL